MTDERGKLGWPEEAVVILGDDQARACWVEAGTCDKRAHRRPATRKTEEDEEAIRGSMLQCV